MSVLIAPSSALTAFRHRVRAFCASCVALCLAGAVHGAILAPPPIDMFVVLDESSSWTSTNFGKQRDFYVDIGNSFTFGSTAMNAGVAAMGTSSRIAAELTASKTIFLTSVNAVSQAGGFSNLLPALTLVQGRLEGSTRTVERVVVFISDGVFGDDATQLEAKMDELEAAGFHLFPIAVGTSADPRMSSFARNGQFFNVADANQFDALVNSVVIAIASVPEPGSGALLAMAGLMASYRRWRQVASRTSARG